MSLWKNVRKDLGKGIQGGVDAFWKGALRMRKQADVLTRGRETAAYGIPAEIS